MHHIQKYILRVLAYTTYARFRDMRPAHVDSNAYSYHLKALQKEGLVEKTARGYRLSPKGLSYVDRVSIEKFEVRLQPKIITMLVSWDEAGRVQLWQKQKQPFSGAWTLPNGKMHITDESVEAAALREAGEKIDLQPEALKHVGACSIRAFVGGELVSYVLAHIFVAELPPGQALHENTRWCGVEDRAALKLAPATEEIIQKVQTSQDFFFAEYTVDWTLEEVDAA